MARLRPKSVRGAISFGFSWVAIGVGLSGLIAIVVTTISGGLGELSLSFLLLDPANAGREGGIAPILVSTALILVIALAVAIPLGLATAFLLSEFRQTFPISVRFVSLSLDILAGVPSVIFGLFGSIFFAQWLGLGLSLYSGGFTLAFMILPYFTRMVEQGFRRVPEQIRLGAACLSLTRSTTIFRVILPICAPSVIIATVLSIARALSETAALIFTSGYVDRMPESLSDSGRALSVHIYDLAMNVAGGDAAAHRSALVLLVFLLVIFQIAHFIERWWKKRVSGFHQGTPKIRG